MDQPNGNFIVIGAGLPRTGTLSLKEALEHLLGGPCYHMQPFVMEGGDYDTNHWKDALKANKQGQSLPDDRWIKFLDGRGYKAGVDFPISFFYQDLVKIFPEAKVVLTVRSPETWHESVKTGILRTQNVIRRFPTSWLVALRGGSDRTNIANDFSWATPNGFEDSMFSGVLGGTKNSEKFFNRWIETVKATVPADRLLIFEVKQGWEPLCKFLGLPKPDIPFPRVNDSASMKSLVDNLERGAWALTFAIPTIVAGLIYYYKDGLGF